MAVVQRSKIWICGHWFHRVVKCAPNGEFSIALPTEFPAVLGIREVTGKGMQETINKFDQSVKDFAERQEQRRKVILYEVKRECFIWHPTENRVDIKYNQMSFTEGLALQICACVCEEIYSPGLSSPYRYEQLPSTIPRSLSSGFRFSHPRAEPDSDLIEWSEEREALFAKIGLGMEGLIRMLEAFKSPEQLIVLAATQPNISLLQIET